MTRTLPRFRSLLRLTALLVVAGCNASAFESCWVPSITFSGGDAGAPTQTTSTYVARSPRPEPVPPDDEPDEPRPTTPQPPLGYNRIPAFPAPDDDPQPSSNARTVRRADQGQGASGAPRQEYAGQGPTGEPPAGASPEDAPQSNEAPSPEVVVAPYYDGYGAYGGRGRGPADQVPSTVMPGVRPAAPGVEQPPSLPPQQQPVQNNPRYELPANPVVPVAPGPVNFRVPPPPAAGPRIP